ncbi:hypothetical protein CW749_03365 [Vibrio sp. vnigr-6D03]|uniref:alpha/beta fold hydrolase n=1 Tax=Vibrio sp. vnigr-6D03 TaxID=2058088 RepID=UPI000C336EBE|nr:alpha/beta fold hydrolase [Vibrio sp. vnigr-6D03]PKF80826.1 hypothetical protein CW749_03365 [Vibrio sp. vnigr-6D03]
MKKVLIGLAVGSLLTGCFTGGSSSASNSGNKGTSTGQTTSKFTQAYKVSTLVAKQCKDFKVSKLNYQPPSFVKQCWELTVPEDYSKPLNGNTITIPIAKASSKSVTKKGSIVYFTGGPGGSALADSDNFSDTLIRDNHDLYLVDQRGTGFSQPSLFCGFAGSASESELKQCKANFVNQGVDLNAYNTKNNALDMIVLRKKLEELEEINDKWTLVGGSYGTRLAAAVLREEDKLTKLGMQKESGIKAMVLDGVFPTQVSGLADLKWANYESLKRIVEVCSRSKNCTPTQLREGIKHHIVGLTADLHQPFLNFVLNSMSNDTDDFGEGKLTIPTLLALDTVDIASSLRSNLSTGSSNTDTPDYFAAMGLSVACSEEYGFQPYYKAHHPERAKWGNEVQKVVDASYHMGFSSSACKAWSVKKADLEESKPITNSNVPVLITNGGNDYQTPPSWGELVVKDFKNSRSITDDTLGHVVLFEGTQKGCVHNLIKDFVDDPSQLNKLDDSCLKSLKFTYK